MGVTCFVGVTVNFKIPALVTTPSADASFVI